MQLPKVTAKHRALLMLALFVGCFIHLICVAPLMLMIFSGINSVGQQDNTAH